MKGFGAKSMCRTEEMISSSKNRRMDSKLYEGKDVLKYKFEKN